MMDGRPAEEALLMSKLLLRRNPSFTLVLKYLHRDYIIIKFKNLDTYYRNTVEESVVGIMGTWMNKRLCGAAILCCNT